MQRPYFKQNPQDPKPLSIIIERRVLFNELDPLNIMWHGNYASFFEQGRIALGQKYGCDYTDFYDHQVLIPLKQFHVDFKSPLKFNDLCIIETFLHYNEAARLDFSFKIYCNNVFTTSGYSVHLMIDKNKNILVIKPDFFEAVCDRWKSGLLA